MDQGNGNTTVDNNDDVIKFEAKRSKILQYMAHGPDDSDGLGGDEENQPLIIPLSLKPSDLIINKPVGFVSAASSRIKIGINSHQSSRASSCCPSQHDLACESNISFCSANTAPLPYRKDMFWDMGMLQTRLSSTAILNEWVSKTSQRRLLAESFHRDLPRLTRLISNTKVNITESMEGRPKLIHSSTALAKLDEICPVEEDKIVINNDGFFTPPCTSMTFIGANDGLISLTPDVFNALRNQVIVLDGMVRSDNRSQLAIEAPDMEYCIAQVEDTNTLDSIESQQAPAEDHHDIHPPITHSESATSCSSPIHEPDNDDLINKAQLIVKGVLQSAVMIFNREAEAKAQTMLIEKAKLIVQGVLKSAIQIVRDTKLVLTNDTVSKPEDLVVSEPKENDKKPEKVKPAVAPKPKRYKAKKLSEHLPPSNCKNQDCTQRTVASGDVTHHSRLGHIHDVQSVLIDDDILIQEGSTRDKIQHFEHMRNILMEGDTGKSKTREFKASSNTSEWLKHRPFDKSMPKKIDFGFGTEFEDLDTKKYNIDSSDETSAVSTNIQREPCNNQDKLIDIRVDEKTISGTNIVIEHGTIDTEYASSDTKCDLRIQTVGNTRAEDDFSDIDIHSEVELDITPENPSINAPQAPSAGFFRRLFRRIRRRFRKKRIQASTDDKETQVGTNDVSQGDSTENDIPVLDGNSASNVLNDVKADDDDGDDVYHPDGSISSSEIDISKLKTPYKFLIGGLCYKH